MRGEAVEQLSAFLANKPCVVANLCAGLSEHGVTIQAMTVLDTVDIGTMRMVVDDVEKAKEALDKAGAAYVAVPVMAITMPNKKGGFVPVAQSLAARNINIEYFYVTAAQGTDAALGIFRVSNLEDALSIDFDI